MANRNLRTGGSCCRYFGFQPIEGLSNHTELHASLLPPPLPRQPSWTATDAQEFPEPKLLTLDSVPLAEPSEDLVALRVRVDEAPEGGFREGEGLSVRLWTLPDNNVAGSTAVLAAEVVAANPGAMLSKQGQPIEVEAAGGLKGFGRYYVTVGPLGGCCR